MLAVVFAYLGYLSFGYPSYFDKLFILVLLFLISTFKISKDLFTIGLILLIERGVAVLLFEVSALVYIKALVYFSGFYLIYKLKYDTQTRTLLLPLLILTLFIEAYWFLTGYSAPRIHTYIALIYLNLITRFFLIFRAHIFRNMFKGEVSSTSLDLSLYRIAGFYNWMLVAMIVEYFIRHTTHFNLTTIYNSYSLLAQFASLVTLYFILSYVVQAKFRFKA